nr:hypothetical protein [Tanacetum cinerariifolium]
MELCNEGESLNSVRTHPHSNRNVVPTTVLTRSRLVSLNAARPVPTAFTQSTVKITYTYVHSEVLYWSIPSEDPYEEAARQLLVQAPCSPKYVPDPIKLEDHVPSHIPEHTEDLVPAEDEAYILEVASAPTPPLPTSFLSPRIRPLHTRAAMAQIRAAVPSTYHSLL